MTVAYIDTSWLVERRSGLQGGRSLPRDHAAFVTSVMTKVEVARTMRRDAVASNVDQEVKESLLGIDAVPVSDLVVATAYRLPVRHLKALDAIHVASALITRCDVVLTRDRQMARACEELGLQVA
ncbi:MAG: PIN domain-containing protein [Candidatus Nanopelagicales bacterium]|nr:PIN domain-containing protein [Candidatus Nanopelagicales bacterium]MCF8538034.1 PIN domain-containing protein [Candidatus Nanopelagicales bacterium]MCF8542954.1 PIN domain-containing protein [Candidatus Nanopelagicales bacterium]MCF8557847.1 PIN domain-containing protein [Candidatus Nanopelagicales bacterium]